MGSSWSKAHCSVVPAPADATGDPLVTPHSGPGRRRSDPNDTGVPGLVRTMPSKLSESLHPVSSPQHAR